MEKSMELLLPNQPLEFSTSLSCTVFPHSDSAPRILELPWESHPLAQPSQGEGKVEVDEDPRASSVQESPREET